MIILLRFVLKSDWPTNQIPKLNLGFLGVRQFLIWFFIFINLEVDFYTDQIQFRLGFQITFRSPGKVGCVLPMDVVFKLPHAEFGSNDHREDAPHFKNRIIWCRILHLIIEFVDDMMFYKLNTYCRYGPRTNISQKPREENIILYRKSVLALKGRSTFCKG